MPLQIQIPYRGDEYLFQGISSAGANLGEGITQMTANLKKLKAYRTMATDALAMDPDKVDKMSLPELEGHFQATALKSQMANTAAQAMERQARAQELEQRAAEGEAWPQFMQQLDAGGTPPPVDPNAPPGSAPATPDMFSRENIMHAMAGMGATNPRLAAALSREIIPKLMEQDAGPKSYTSPAGNPYVWMNHTVLPDKSPLDPNDINAMMGPSSNGYEAVPNGKGGVQYLKTGKTLPPTFHSALDKVSSDIAGAQSTLDADDGTFADAKTATAMKASAKRRLTAAQSQGKAIIERYHATGYLNDDERDNMFQDLGLAPAKPAAAAAAAGTPGKVLPLPKTKAELKKGNVYQTGRGPATWDGTQFVPQTPAAAAQP